MAATVIPNVIPPNVIPNEQRNLYVTDEVGKYGICYRYQDTLTKCNGPYRYTLEECNKLISKLKMFEQIMGTVSGFTVEGYWPELNPETEHKIEAVDIKCDNDIID